MINIDTRLLKKLDESEMWLLVQIAARLNQNRECWPSNKMLLKDCGWHIEKLQKVKRSLMDKGILKTEFRMNSIGGQGSNVYKVTTKYVSIFLGLESLKAMPEKPTPDRKKQTGHPDGLNESYPPENPTTEVLTSEVLIKEKTDAATPLPKSTVYQDSIELYHQFCKATIGAGAKINAGEGKAMKEIIAYLRANSEDKSDAGVLKAFNFIWGHWDRLEPFLRAQKKLVQINSNLINIINQLRNGNAKQQSTTADTLRKINDLVRRESAGRP